MKKLLTITAAVLLSLCMPAQTKVTFVPQWTPQSQFAGYYLALEKGFYAQEGLDVTIKHMGANSSESVCDQLFNGNAQIVGMQLLQAAIARADGCNILNVFQLTQKSGLWCIGHNPLTCPEDLDGLRIGRWKVGFSEFCDILEAYKGIHINWIPFIQGINMFVFGAVDAILCYNYSEYIAIRMAMGDIEDDHVLKFSEYGYDCPEDGLYVREDYYDGNRETVEKFVRASKKGWDYARQHPEEAVDISMRYVKEANVVSDRTHQKLMLEEYLHLHDNPATGKADYAPVDRKIFEEMNEALINTGYTTRKIDFDEIIR